MIAFVSGLRSVNLNSDCHALCGQLGVCVRQCLPVCSNLHFQWGEQMLWNCSSIYNFIFLYCYQPFCAVHKQHLITSPHFPSFDIIAFIQCSNLFISSSLIQELPCGILERQNAVLCHQMIPLSATTAAGQQKRSHIPHLGRMNEDVFTEPQGKGPVCFPSAAEYAFLPLNDVPLLPAVISQ